MNKEQQDKAMFVSFCIEQYAKAKNMATEDVVNLFEQYGIAEHFCEFYDVLHTHGGQWLVEEIDKMINEKKKMSKVYHEVSRKLETQRYVSQTVLSTMALASTQQPLTNRLRNWLTSIFSTRRNRCLPLNLWNQKL